jgi:iron complex outermembrane receptor protein
VPLFIRPAVRLVTPFIRKRPALVPGRYVLPGLALCAVLVSSPVLAQSPVVTGRVVDPAGALVAGARVALTPLGDNRSTFETRSDARGSFHWDHAAEGDYVLTVEARGFATSTRHVRVDPSLEPLTVHLEVASVTQTVTVEADRQASVARTSAPATDLPTNIGIVSRETLQTFAVNDLVTALQSVPNVNAYTQYGAYEYYSFRGFSDSVQTVDGVRNEGNRVRSQLANVDRVEVLKGPASVLYGADAIGATVNLVLKKPSVARTYEGGLSLGSWRTSRISAGSGGRLAGPRLLYRIDAALDHSNGFRHDVSTRLNVTPTITWRASHRDQIDIRYSLNRNDLSGDSGIPLQTLADGTQVIPDVPRDRRFNTPDDFARSTDHNLRAAYTRSLTDRLTLRAVLSGRHYDDDYWVAETLRTTAANEVHRTFLYFKHARQPWFGQVELSGAVRAGVDHDILAGWEHQNYRTRTTRSAAASQATTSIDLFSPVETHVTWTDFPVSRYDYTRLRSHAFYAQDTISLGTRVKIVGGLRLDRLDRRTNNNPVTNGIETPVDPVQRRANALTYRTGLVYQPTSRVDVFAQHATAFRPNYNLQADGRAIDPETGRQVEGGYRLRLLDGRLDLTSSIFQITKQNIALARPGGVYDLAGGIRSRGVEQEVEWRPSVLTRAAVGYGYTNAVYTDYSTTSAELTGNLRPRTPRHTMNASAVVSFPNGLSVSVLAQTRGRQFLDDANTLSLDGYGLLNVALGYSRGALQYGLTLSNLTNTDYWSSALGGSQLYPGEPINVMATIRLLSR